MANFDVYYSASSGSPSNSYVQIGSLAATSCSSGSCTYSWLDTEASNTDTVLNTARIKINNALASNAPLYVETEGASDFKRGASVTNLTVFNGPYIDVGSTTTDINCDYLTHAFLTQDRVSGALGVEHSLSANVAAD